MVRIVEVGPRDGLQNEAVSLSPPTRIGFVERLIAAGLTTIEVGSFVSPRWVPQMEGTDIVLRGLGSRQGVDLPVLVPNVKGLDAALEAGAREIAIFASASEPFSQKNINCSIAQSIDRFRPVAERAIADGVRIRGYVSCVLGCPYQGSVPVADVVSVVAALRQLGCYEVSLGDTTGVGTPSQARDLVRAVRGAMPVEEVAAHFHDTYGQALAKTCMPCSRKVCASSMPPPAAWGAVPMPRARAAMSPPRPWSTCSTAWACGPASICRNCSTRSPSSPTRPAAPRSRRSIAQCVGETDDFVGRQTNSELKGRRLA
jgi:hydroxymethylglutaryl-CoA lyase